jgi:glycerophosphoryl diester phosphodiesterase
MVKILGHRGLRHKRGLDENARGALERALLLADGVEADVAVSRDGTPYIMHDISVRYAPRLFTRSHYALKENLDRGSRRIVGARRFEELADAEIEGLRLRQGGRIMRLAELFAIAARAPQKIINLELKNPEAAEAVVRELDHAVSLRRARREQMIVTSFDTEALRRLKTLDRRIRRGLILLPPGAKSAPIYPWRNAGRGLYRDFSAATFNDPLVRAAEPHFFTVTPRALGRDNLMLLLTEAPGKKLLLWMPKESLPGRHRAAARALENPLAAGLVEAVISARPDALAARLNARQKLLPKP